jgi:hypothetical protein
MQGMSMKNKGSYFGQIIAYTVFMAVVGLLSTAPSYNPAEPGKAMIKLSFSHAGSLAGECREMTDKELSITAPNMRRPLICPRERLPVLVQFEIDGEILLSEAKAPAGLHNDGASYVYEKFLVEPGKHELTVRIRDSARSDGFDYTGSKKVDLHVGHNYVIEFSGETGKFAFR